MKKRNRVIYQSESIHVSNDIDGSLVSDHEELVRIQDAAYGFTMNRTDVSQYGLAARIDAIHLDMPTVNFDLSYYLGDGFNESSLGFNIDESAQFVKGHLELGGEKNFYITTSEEGLDSVDLQLGDSYSLMGIGNAFLTDYSVNMSVGSLPVVSLTYEASNINSSNGIVSGDGFWDTDISGSTASIDIDKGIPYDKNIKLYTPKNTGENGPTALRPGDISLNFNNFVDPTISSISGEGSFHLQSALLSIPLPRTELKRMGSKSAYARPIDYPIKATLTTNSILSNTKTVQLAEQVKKCSLSNNDISISAKNCDGKGAINWTLLKPLLKSERFSSNIGPNKSVDLVFEVEIGDSLDITRGIICSGDASNRFKPKEDDDEGVPTRVYGYESDDPQAAQGVFTGPDNILLDYELGNVIDSWKINAVNNFGWGTRDNIKRLALGGSTSSIGNYAFRELKITGEVYMPPSITDIGNFAFEKSHIKSVTFNTGLVNLDGSKSFSACPFLESVTWTDSVESIGDFMFYQSANLSDFYWSKSLQTIGSNAFNGCNSLNNVDFYEGLTSIGTYCFRLCNSIPEVIFPDSFTQMCNRAFQQCGVSYVQLGEQQSGLGSYGFFNCASLTSIDFGETVEYINQNCFASCTALPVLNLPDSIIKIGPSAFNGDTSLITINFGEGLVNIENNAFRNCRALSGVNFPEDLVFNEIGVSAFQGCYGIQDTIKLPDTLTEVSNYAFADCYAFTSLEIGAGLDTIETGCFARGQGLTGLDVPPNIININQSAFSTCTSLLGINFSENIEYIGSYAFQSCSSLSGVNFPESIDVVDTNAFEYSTSLRYIEFNTNIDYDDVSNYCFRRCLTLTGVDLTPNILSIGQGSFQSCVELSGINFNETITDIGISAFAQCYDLSGVTYPQSLNYVGNYAFQDCITLQYIDFNTNPTFDRIETGCFQGCTTLPNVVIPDNIITVRKSAFRNCTSLESVDFGDFTEWLGSSAFESCTSFNNLVMPDTITGIFNEVFTGCVSLDTMGPFPEILTYIGKSAFSNCALTGIQGELTIPDSVGYIGGRAFAFNEFTAVDLGDSVDYLRYETFLNCPNLSGINLNLITGIERNCFQNCTSLTGVLIYPVIEEIGTYAFANTAVIDTTIPNSIDYINQGVFAECSDLTGVISGELLTGIGSYAFLNCNSLLEYYPPDSLIGVGTHSFEGCTSMSGLEINLIESIGTSAFQGCTSLPPLLVLPSTVGNVDDSAFEGCTSLTGIDWAIGVNNNEISKRTFRNCTSISGLLTVQSDIVKIDAEAFKGCTSLTGVVFPEGIDSIGGGIRDYIGINYLGAFQNCTNISGTIVLPDSLTWLGKFAFDGCNQIETFEFHSPTQPTTRKDAFPAKFYNDPGNNPIHAPIGAETSYSGQSFVPSNSPLIYGPQRNPVNWSELNIIFDL